MRNRSFLTRLARSLSLVVVALCCPCVSCGDFRPRCLPHGAAVCPPRASEHDAAWAPVPTLAYDSGLGTAWETGISGRAILVSVDGLGAVYLRAELARGNLPTFALLARSGSSTLNARTDYDFTVTLPNHTSMLTGRPVAEDPALPDDAYHGFTENSPVPYGVTLHNAGNPHLAYVASMFDVAHDHGRKTCLYSGKSKFALFTSSYDAVHGAPDGVGEDNGRNKIDRYAILEDTSLLIDAAEAALRGGMCDLAFVHIADLDRIGHGDGWGSEPWLSALARIDGWILRLLHFADPWWEPSPFGFVLTADHGGHGSSHLEADDRRDYTIPFFVAGPGIPPDTDLYALAAPTRVDPADSRPRNAGFGQPVRNADAGNTTLSLMGLPPIPGSIFRDLLTGP